MPDCKSWVALEGLRTYLLTQLTGAGYYALPVTNISYGPLPKAIQGDLPALIMVPADSVLAMRGIKRHDRRMSLLIHVIAKPIGAQSSLQALMNLTADVELAITKKEWQQTSLDENGARVLAQELELKNDAFNPDLTEFFGRATGTIELLVPLWFDHSTA